MNVVKKQYLLIINDGPYGNERPYNALRVAMNLAKREEAQASVFLIGDGVQCAIMGQGWLTPRAGYSAAPRGKRRGLRIMGVRI